MPEGEATRVSWTINGPKPFMERAVMTMMGIDLEAMIGSDYETGLASLKQVVEAEAAKRASEAPADSPENIPAGEDVRQLTAPGPAGNAPTTSE